jgi:hypothetical protein
MAGLPCIGNCGCVTDRMVDLGDGEVPYCLWCEDGIPCTAAANAAAQPVRELPATRKTLTIKVPQPETTDLMRKSFKKAAPKIKAAMKKAVQKASEQISERVHRVDGLEAQVSAHHGKSETLGDQLPKAIKMAEARKSSGEIAEALGVPPWKVYQSAGVRAVREKLGTMGKPMPRAEKKAANKSRVTSAVAKSNGNGLVPVFLSEAALNRVWQGSSLEEKAKMITDYLAQVEPA